jgi:hypothetical protein
MENWPATQTRQARHNPLNIRYFRVRRNLQGIREGMKVRLTRKYANTIDGIDLQGREPGDVFDLCPEDARLLLAEEWAVPERREADLPGGPRRREADFPKGSEIVS